MDIKKTTVYIAGKITGDKNYKDKFYHMAKELEDSDMIVVNPALLPSEGFTHDAYMRMSSAMLDECDSVCFLSDWTESKGAMYEYGRAVALRKDIFFYDDFRREKYVSES